MTQKAKFLLVDDLEENLVALEAVLRDTGVALLRARSGAEALELLLAHEVALALVDVQMPGMDGFELAELMRGTERTRHVPIIFLTAWGEDRQRLFRGYEAGAVDFLHKPVDPVVLRGKAAVFLELYQQRQELAHQRDALQATTEALRRSERHFRTIADGMPQLVWTSRPDGGVEFVNRRWRDYTGLPADVPHPAFLGEPLHPADGEAVRARWQHSLQTGEPFEVECRLRRADGAWRWFLVRAQPLHADSGAISRWFGTCTDIHAQKQVAEFEQQLLGIVSHDLRNPLGAISVVAEALRRRGELDPRTAQSVERIARSADRATRLVHDLLDLTKVRLGGGIPLSPRAADVHAIVRGVVQELEATQSGRVIQLSQSGDGAGTWDPDRLSQAASNLISNALHYGPAHEPVQVETRGEASMVELRVHNGGAPIPPERLPHIFEPFERGTAGDASRRSIGLGLYITKDIAERHGGSIAVLSEEGLGTTFTLRLPRAP